jgi:glutamine amidotransferase
MTTIIDYGMGNLGSIQNMLKKLGEPSIITANPVEIEQAIRLILPGVGAFDTGMNRLTELNLIPILNKMVLEKKIPILGICLGLQLMTKSSKEGISEGLNWFDAETTKFNINEMECKLVLPNMGWRNISIKKDVPLFDGFNEESEFYFVHNFHIVSNCKKQVGMTSEYGYEFVSSLVDDNILGVQFHPEKSHKFGLKLLQNYINNY